MIKDDETFEQFEIVIMLEECGFSNEFIYNVRKEAEAKSLWALDVNTTGVRQ